MKYDLHVHTYYSDGIYSPQELIDNAIEKGLDGMAITDHDTVLGIDEALKYSKDILDFKVIPGIELSCIGNYMEVHLLGYFIDYKDGELLSRTHDLRQHRIKRVEKIIEKLQSLNLKVDFEKIKEANDNGFVGRVAVARELKNKGYVSNIQEAFNKYLNPGKPAYVERFKLSVEDGISLIKKANGIPVLAHPGLLKDKSLVQYCIDRGIEGIEYIHSKHTPSQVDYFKNIAINNKLIGTGGSDCHGEINNNELLLGQFYIDMDQIPKMKERLNDYI